MAQSPPSLARTGARYGCAIASCAVSRSWWSYRSSLSMKSIASALTRCWFSLFTNLVQGLRECLCAGAARSEQQVALRSTLVQRVPPANERLQLRVQLQAVLVQVRVERVGAKHLQVCTQGSSVRSAQGAYHARL